VDLFKARVLLQREIGRTAEQTGRIVDRVARCFMPNTHRRRRRGGTKQFRLVGVGGVYWAL